MLSIFLRSLNKVYGKDILYIQMADHGILKHVLLYWSETSTSYSPLEKKVSQKGQLNISNIELKTLMTTIHAKNYIQCDLRHTYAIGLLVYMCSCI